MSLEVTKPIVLIFTQCEFARLLFQMLIGLSKQKPFLFGKFSCDHEFPRRRKVTEYATVNTKF